MSIFDWIIQKYKTCKDRRTMDVVASMYSNEIRNIHMQITREYMRRVFAAAIASFEQVMFKGPEEYRLIRALENKDIILWLREVTLAIIGYSMHMLKVQNIKDQNKYNEYWDAVISDYNKIFKTKAGRKDVNLYAIGLIEEGTATNEEEMLRTSPNSMLRDAAIISKILMQNIWNEQVDENSIEEYANNMKEVMFAEKQGKKATDYPLTTQKAVMIGGWIWKAYQYYVQPYFEEAMKADIDNYLA